MITCLVRDRVLLFSVGLILLFVVGLVKPLSADGPSTFSVSLSANPSTVTVTAGSFASTTITVTIQPTDATISNAAISCNGLPAGAACATNPSPLPTPLHSGQEFTLTVNVPSSTPPGTYQVTVHFSYLPPPPIIQAPFLAISPIQFSSSGGIGPSAILPSQLLPVISLAITVIVQPATFPAVHQTPVGGVMFPSVGFTVLLPWALVLSLLGIVSVEAFRVRRHAKQR